MVTGPIDHSLERLLQAQPMAPLQCLKFWLEWIKAGDEIH